MKKHLALPVLASALLLAAACAAPTAQPTPTAPPKAPATVAPTEKPAAKESPTTAPAKPAATTAPTAAPTAAAAAKPGTPSVVTIPVNASGIYDASNTLILYGDLAFFAGRDNPESCVLKSRYKRGEPVGFRMTAIDPATGQFAEGAELTIKITYGGKTETLQMRYRGTGESPRPGFWTAKWVVPDDAPVGVVRYTVEARDKEGRTGIWSPYNIESSMLTIVE